MAEVVVINDPKDFEAALAEISASQEFVICVFTGGVDPSTGKNWCPDCETHKPRI
jgi:hypothetical protein